MKYLLVTLIALISVSSAIAQDTPTELDSSVTADSATADSDSAAPSVSFGFQSGIVFATEILPTGSGGEPETWTRLGIQPEFSFGKIGVGLDLTLHFQMNSPPSWDDIRIYSGDWVPSGDRTLFEIYFAKISYLRYGTRGEDPLYAKLGSIKDFTLGDGFIMSNYSNMLFLPDRRLFGLDLALDGALFKFPSIGFEAIAGNLARFDVVGGRFFVRPFADSATPLIKGLQAGATIVVDRQPYLHGTAPYINPEAPIAEFGADIVLPVLGGSSFPLSAFTDIAFQPNGRSGEMIGVGGCAFGFLTWGAQLRFLQSGFIPSYFDANYDLYRQDRFDQMHEPGTGVNTAGWYASIGLSLFNKLLVFTVAFDGPISSTPTVFASDQAEYPHSRSVFRLGEGLLPFYFDASYEKYFIGRKRAFFPDLAEPNDSVIGLSANYRSGPSVLSIIYNAAWDPSTLSMVVRSSIQSTIKL